MIDVPFNRYLTSQFSQSNLNASLCEVIADYELRISTWLGYGKHSKQDLERVKSLAIEIFESVFSGYTEPIWALINHWDIQRDIYTFNQFRGLNEANYEAWISFDETHEVDREQIIIQTTVENINYQNIIKAAIDREYDHDSSTCSSRVYFINPRTNVYYLHFDSEVILGSNEVLNLAGHFHRYYRYMEDGRRINFEKHITQFKFKAMDTS